MSPVDFEKKQCRPVEFKGQGPQIPSDKGYTKMVTSCSDSGRSCPYIQKHH